MMPKNVAAIYVVVETPRNAGTQIDQPKGENRYQAEHQQIAERIFTEAIFHFPQERPGLGLKIPADRGAGDEK